MPVRKAEKGVTRVKLAFRALYGWRLHRELACNGGCFLFKASPIFSDQNVAGALLDTYYQHPQ